MCVFCIYIHIYNIHYICLLLSKYLIQRVLRKKFRYCYIFVLWSWVPEGWLPTVYLHLNDLSTPQTQSAKKNMYSSFFFPQGPASFPDFCVSINGISRIIPITQPRNLESSFVCFTFHLSLCNSFYMFPLFHVHSHHLFLSLFNDYYNKSLIGLYSSLFLNWYILKDESKSQHKPVAIPHVIKITSWKMSKLLLSMVF